MSGAALAIADTMTERTMRDLWNALPRAKQLALKTFQDTNNITEACKVAGIHRTTWNKWLESDLEFKEIANTLYEGVVDNLECVAFNRASAGNDNMLKFMLEAHRPDRYRRDQGKDSSINVAIQVQQFSSNE